MTTLKVFARFLPFGVLFIVGCFLGGLTSAYHHQQAIHLSGSFTIISVALGFLLSVFFAASLPGIEREKLIDTVLSARTPEQCDHAEKLIIAWMKDHPRDFGILDAGEQLAMMSERYDHPAGWSPSGG